MPKKHKKLIGSVALLALILCIGAFLRVRSAPSTASGDTGAFRNWMESSVKLGLVRSYEEQLNGSPWLPNYPPFSILLFQAAGVVYQWTYSPDYQVIDPAHMVFAKGPAMIADLLTCVALFVLFTRWKRLRLGLLAAAIYAWHPAVMYDSTLWGQTDSIYVFLILASLVSLVWKKHATTAVFFTLAVFTKPQALMFLPFVVFLVPWQWRTIARMAGTAGLTVGFLLFPFLIAGKLPLALAPFNLMHVMVVSRLSWNAYNAWWLVFGPQAWDRSAMDAIAWGITYRMVSIVLFGIVYVGTLAALRPKLRGNLAEHQNGEAVFMAAGIIALAMFVLGVEMHERYLFPFLALALPWACLCKRGAVLYAIISLLFLLNLAMIFPHGALNGELFARFPTLSTIIAAALTTSLCFLLTDVVRLLPAAWSPIMRWSLNVFKARKALPGM